MKKIMFLCGLIGESVIGGEVLEVKENSFAGTGSDKVTLADGIFTMDGNSMMYYKSLLPIDTSKKYRLSGEFKTAANSIPGDYIRFGVQPGTKDAPIGPVNINIVKDSETELVKDCAPTDTVLKIKDGSNWKGGAISLIAFDIDPSGKLRDLPNFNISGTGITKIEKAGDIWEVTLNAPCGKNFPAGTPVREHLAGWSLIYAGHHQYVLTGDWVKLEHTFNPGEVATASIKEWWKGTRRASICVELQGKGGQFRNIKLEEVE